MGARGWRSVAGFVLVAAAAAQTFTERGFVETGAVIFPESAANDSAHLAADSFLRYEGFYKLTNAVRFAGALDARIDTHREVDRALHLSWWDRERARPALALRRLSAAWTHGKVTLEAGKQFIRWGKADLLNPTDRFAPRDFLNVVDNDFLAVPAARLTYGGQANSIDIVWQPRFTPSRVPLLDQRWVVLPAGIPAHDLGAVYPGGSQAGARWNHIGRLAEYSLSFFDGHNHLPVIRAVPDPVPAAVGLQRYYAQMRMYGGDAAIPLRAVTIKAEAAWFTSSTRDADEYALYVVQLERQAGEWFFVGGYAGQRITARRTQLDFAPDRGLARAFLGRAGYTIDANRSVASNPRCARMARESGHEWNTRRPSDSTGAPRRQ